MSQRAQVKYEVVGTLSDKSADKPACVEEIVEVLIGSDCFLLIPSVCQVYVTNISGGNIITILTVLEVREVFYWPVIQFQYKTFV